MTTFKKINYTQTIKISTITPVSIGNGEVLSPYTDFVFDDQKDVIHILDKDKIARRIVELDEQRADGQSKLMDDYISLIYGSFDNNRSEFDLKKFIEDAKVLGLTVEDYAKQSVPHYGLQTNDRREIKCTIKNQDQAFIPGSTIKGAIKSCLLYFWLNSRKDKLGKLMRIVLSMYERFQVDLEKIRRFSSKRYLSIRDKNELRYLKQLVIKKGVGTLAEKIDNAFESLLTEEYQFFPRDFHHLKVGDSKPFLEQDTVFQVNKRLHYVKGNISIPVNIEAIKRGTVSDFRLSITPKFIHDDLAFFNQEQPLVELFKRINKFHKDNIDMELELLDINPWFDNARQRDCAKIEDYQNFLENMYNRIDEAPSNEAYLCLGFGKSFFYNSIGMLVRDWDESEEPLADENLTIFQKYCRLFFLGRGGDHFPITRTITNDGLPMGWVRLETA